MRALGGSHLFTFPEAASSGDDFFMTDLMAEYSTAVVLEGDSPLSYADLSVFVAPTPRPRERLFVRRSVPRPGRGKQSADLERLLEEPTAVAELMGQLIGEPAAAMLRSRPELVEAARAEMLAKLDQDRQSPAPPPTKRWAVSDRYAGIERAQLVIVNVRDQEDSRRADELVSDLAKLRQDQKIFSDVLGYRGNRISITAVAGNVTDPANPCRMSGTGKAQRSVTRRHAKSSG